jgi:hypothetical protein
MRLGRVLLMASGGRYVLVREGSALYVREGSVPVFETTDAVNHKSVRGAKGSLVTVLDSEREEPN